MKLQIESKNGYFLTNCQIRKPPLLENALQKFLLNKMEYKTQYLQKNYSYGFYGYSYMGQKDSTNQYASDLLHSFVISDFHPIESYPKEFHEFLQNEWKVINATVAHIERTIIDMLDYKNKNEIKQFYTQNIGHMLSMNHYPKVEEDSCQVRLSAHKDVSLLSVFPFGIQKDLMIQNFEGRWVKVKATKKVIVLTGYLLECITKGAIKGINHKVMFSKKFNPEIQWYYFLYH